MQFVDLGIGLVAQFTELRLVRTHSRICLFDAQFKSLVESLELHLVDRRTLLLLLVLLLLQTQIVLNYFMSIGFVLNCSDEVLEAANVDFIV